MTNEEFLLFRGLIYNESGMYFKDTKKEFVESRIRKRLKANNIRSVYQYYKYITNNGEGKKELLILLDALTINETSFFRNKPQFDLFREKVMIEIIERNLKENNRSIRIWSAGCSTGEEAYTIAMEGLEAIGKNGGARPLNLEIIGSDISLSVLKVAKEGVYPKERLADVDGYYLKKFFCADGDFYIMSMDVKEHTIFDFHNLKFENGLKDLDIIFCRNVMIYFDEAEQKRLIDKFYKSLRPGGYLFIGHSETLQGLDDRFRFIYFNKGTAYKRI
jgi:chemotaxis protein methyltransferase CheR